MSHSLPCDGLVQWFFPSLLPSGISSTESDVSEMQTWGRAETFRRVHLPIKRKRKFSPDTRWRNVTHFISPLIFSPLLRHPLSGCAYVCGRGLLRNAPWLTDLWWETSHQESEDTDALVWCRGSTFSPDITSGLREGCRCRRVLAGNCRYLSGPPDFSASEKQNWEQQCRAWQILHQPGALGQWSDLKEQDEITGR